MEEHEDIPLLDEGDEGVSGTSSTVLDVLALDDDFDTCPNIHHRRKEEWGSS